MINRKNIRVALLKLLFAVSCLMAGQTWAANCQSNNSGNWNTTGTWTSCGGSVPQAGDNVTIRNSHTVTLNTNSNAIASLTLNSGTSLVTSGATNRTLNLAGNLVNNGTITLTAGTYSGISLSAASTWSGNGTLTADYLNANGSVVTLASASTMIIQLSDATPFLNIYNGFNNGGTKNSSATIILNGGAQTIPVDVITYPNLQVSGGTKTVSGGTSLTVLGNLTIAAGATFDAQTNGLGSGRGIYLAKDLTISGTLLAMGSNTWIFNGSTAQTISAAASLRGVTLNNSAGLILGGNLTVGDTSWGALNLTSGKITTGSYAVVFPRNCAGSLLASRNAGSWIYGNLQLTFPNYGATCIFDVGDANNYVPITLTAASSTSGGKVTGSTTTDDHADTVSGISGIRSTRSVNRYWTLTAGSGAGFSTFDSTFQYCSATGSADCTVNDVDSSSVQTDFIVVKKTSGSWSALTPTAPSTNSRKVSGIASLGEFAIGQPGNSTCEQPANTPAGLTLICQCDSFGRTNLNPSPMFTSSNWVVSKSDSTSIVPYINSSTGFLRLTENSGNNAKSATAPGFFPAAGNYISVEFKHYAYNGSGADGIAVTLSDYTIAPVPGAYGGSLGYAQQSSPLTNGFAGGWIGVGIDEYGNFSNPTEGRKLGPGFIVDGVAVRGSGSGTTGYPYLGGTSGSLSPGVDNAGTTSPAYGHYYQVIVDARNSAAGQTWVAVNRDTSGAGTSYSPVVASFDAYARASAAGYVQAPVPANWQLSFTGSTGGSTNIHELGRVRICAQYYVPPDGGTPGGFSAIDDAYTSVVQNFLTGHIYMKLVNTAFKLKVAALSNSQILTTYAASATKNVTVKLVDNSDNLCGSDADRATACANASCNGKAAVTGGSQTLAFTSTDKGIKTTGDFTLNKAYANLVAVISDGTTTACSIDSFSVRPTLITDVTSTASNATLSGSPAFKAGTDQFSMTATVNAGGYNGTPKINTAAMSVLPSGTGAVVGSFSPTNFPAASAGTTTSESTGNFTYSEVGNFRFLGYNPAVDATSPRGLYDDSWSSVDSAATKNDCSAGSYSNTKGADGKYGCNFGYYNTGTGTPNSVYFGRFIPDHFAYLAGGVTAACSTATTPFTYMGQSGLGIYYRLRAENGAGGVTANYDAGRGYPVVAPVLVAEDQAATNQGCDLIGRISGTVAGTWGNGVYAANDADANNLPDSSTAVFSRPTTPLALTLATCSANRGSAGGPFWLMDVGVKMTDGTATLTNPDMDAASAGVCASGACTAKKIGATAVLDGRLWLNNAYGSEMLPLPVPVQAQYWTASGWQKNTVDVCSVMTLPTAANGGLVFYSPPQTARNALESGEAVAQMNGATTATVNLLGGDARLVLRNPASSTQGPGTGNFGYVDVIGSKLTPSSTWLPPSGNARACFGACGPRSPIIYLRENY